MKTNSHYKIYAQFNETDIIKWHEQMPEGTDGPDDKGSDVQTRRQTRAWLAGFPLYRNLYTETEPGTKGKQLS